LHELLAVGQHGGPTKRGDACLREAMFIAADHARRADPTLAARYHRLMVSAGKHHNSALCHIATTLLTRLVTCWRNGERYAIRDLDGKLFPFGWAKLLYRVKVKRTKSARLFIMGIRSEYRRNKRYGGLAMAMFVEIAKLGSAVGYQWGELSLTLEDNTLINLGIKAMGGKVYKTYRLYERDV
jgi:hypothetical protein